MNIYTLCSGNIKKIKFKHYDLVLRYVNYLEWYNFMHAIQMKYKEKKSLVSQKAHFYSTETEVISLTEGERKRKAESLSKSC